MCLSHYHMGKFWKIQTQDSHLLEKNMMRILDCMILMQESMIQVLGDSSVQILLKMNLHMLMLQIIPLGQVSHFSHSSCSVVCVILKCLVMALLTASTISELRLTFWSSIIK